MYLKSCKLALHAIVFHHELVSLFYVLPFSCRRYYPILQLPALSSVSVSLRSFQYLRFRLFTFHALSLLFPTLFCDSRVTATWEVLRCSWAKKFVSITRITRASWASGKRKKKRHAARWKSGAILEATCFQTTALGIDA